MIEICRLYDWYDQASDLWIKRSRTIQTFWCDREGRNISGVEADWCLTKLKRSFFFGRIRPPEHIPVTLTLKNDAKWYQRKWKQFTASAAHRDPLVTSSVFRAPLNKCVVGADEAFKICTRVVRNVLFPIPGCTEVDTEPLSGGAVGTAAPRPFNLFLNVACWPWEGFHPSSPWATFKISSLLDWEPRLCKASSCSSPSMNKIKKMMCFSRFRVFFPR